MIRSFLSTIVLGSIVLTLFVSCKELGSERYELVDNCKYYHSLIMDSLRVDKSTIYYVELDTVNCELLIRFDDEVIDKTIARQFLSNHELIYVPEIDTTVITSVDLDPKSDSLARIDSNQQAAQEEVITHVVEQEEEVEEVIEQVDTASAISLLEDAITQSILDSLQSDTLNAIAPEMEDSL